MKIFVTLDYELFFGSNTGTVEKSIIYPTDELIKISKQYDIRMIFFVDAGYINKLNEFRKKYANLNSDYNQLVAQIETLHNLGHDIQLHIHPHWEDCYFDGNKWCIDSSRFRLHEFNNDEINQIVTEYKNTLINIVGDKIFAFRAGGWCIQPFDKLKRALKSNNIWLDSTVFNGGENASKTHYYNFKNTPKEAFWKFEDDPLKKSPTGYFTEIPISSCKLSPLFFWKMAFLRKVQAKSINWFGDGVPVSPSKSYVMKLLTQPSYSVVSIDGYKASFLQKAYNKYNNENTLHNFVIIGHPKALSRYSLKKLDLFVKENINNNTFSTFHENIKEWQVS